MYFPFIVHGTNIPWKNGHRNKILWNIGPMVCQKLQARTIFPWNIGPPAKILWKIDPPDQNSMENWSGGP